MIQRRISDSPDPAAPENSGRAGEARSPSREPPSIHGVAGSSATGFIFESMCCRNSNEPSDDAGQPGAEPAVEAQRARPRRLIGSAYAFQSTPNGGLASM